MIAPISMVNSSAPIAPLGPIAPNSSTNGPQSAGETFASIVGDALKDINSSQANADNAVKGLLSGNGEDIHQVVLAMEQARLSMFMLVEMRNKVVEAYQEISRMPI